MTMREILFRGQTRKKGEKVRMDGTPVESNWVYGGIFQGQNHSVIYGYDPVEKHVVYSDTIGQYTGLKDKKGQRIFEGDIVVSVNPRRLSNKPFEIKMNPITGGFGYWKLDNPELVEVIGNIHDNPELLKEE